MKICLKVGDRVLTGQLLKNETARDFASLLPFTLRMNDLFRREKYVYWSPGPDVAIFYRHDGQAIPDPGIIVIGSVDSGVEALQVSGAVSVEFEVAG